MLPLGFIFDDFKVYPEGTKLIFNQRKIDSSLFLSFAIEKIPQYTK